MLYTAKTAFALQWASLILFSLAITLLLPPLILAQSPSASSSSSSFTTSSLPSPSSSNAAPTTSTSLNPSLASPGPSQIPIASPPPPVPTIALPPGTRELQDGQVVADTVAQNQLQTYHFSIVQGQNLPAKRQLELVIFHNKNKNNSPLEKRQALSSSSSGSTATSSASVPTRTIAPVLPSRLANGTYAIYISISTCSAPQTTGGSLCPALTLYYSISASQPLPGPGQSAQGVNSVTGQEGLIQATIYTDKEVFFSLQAPQLQGTWTGNWSVQVAASSQGYAQDYQSSQGLILDDTDSSSASFLTQNFTAVPTFMVYLVETASLAQNLSRSVCAIETIQPIPLTKANMTVTETNRTSNLDGSLGTLVLPPVPTFNEFGQRRQVVIQGLKNGTFYTAIFVTDVLNQAGAEVMYAMTPFKTKRHDNCLLITDLSFCFEVAYAVPITPLSTLNAATARSEIPALYDNFARDTIDNFNKVLSQYDCEHPEYSLIRNCTDCTRAYRRWLCSVSIPRCTDSEDVTSPENIGYIDPSTIDPTANPYLIDRTKGPVVTERNTSTSRGAISQLNQQPYFNPGDYGEVLPCINLCYDVVQSCPNFLGFACPKKNLAGNYATMNGQGFQCNGLGLVAIPSSGRRIEVNMLQVGVGMMLAMMAIIF
ncbi:stretch-activated cation channel mid1 [Entomortierella lignicola]|nr:stretch-activated cation channel mid1 [Entomortierella lignicola]